jgi:hypothetical protein
MAWRAEELAGLFGIGRTALLATRDARYGVHLVAVNAFALGDDGALGVLTRSSSRKARNLRLDARCALSVLEQRRYLTVLARAVILEDAASVAMGEAAFGRAFGRNPRLAPPNERVLVVLTVVHTLGDLGRD